MAFRYQHQVFKVTNQRPDPRINIKEQNQSEDILNNTGQKMQDTGKYTFKIDHQCITIESQVE